MRFNVAQLLKEPIGASRAYDTAEEGPALNEGGKRSFVQGDVSLLRLDRGILVEGRLRLAVEEECSRCLEPFIQSVAIELQEIYLPTIDIVTGLPLPIDRESDAFYIGHNHEIDLTEAVRQYGLLNTPLKFLCRPDCAGFCPGCGADLNRTTCRCVKEEEQQMATVRVVAAGRQRRRTN
ncbi:MAG: DUF177 domain-containing protein [Chloroflexi bacterium]|nr:DUF177 domain-containing protein [Chloroflexota bacterium]